MAAKREANAFIQNKMMRKSSFASTFKNIYNINMTGSWCKCGRNPYNDS